MLLEDIKMNIENLESNLQNPKNELKEWLSEISLLDGKCCYVSKKSELRARLLLIIDIREPHGEKIKKIFDEKLWMNDENIFEIKSNGLVELQNAISEASFHNKVVSNSTFNLKEEFFKFNLNQSTMLALFIACVIFSRFIMSYYEKIIFLEGLVFVLYMITLFIVMTIVDTSSKIISLILSIFIILFYIGIFLYYYPYEIETVYMGWGENFKLILLLIFNMALVGSSLFSLLHSSNNLISNYKNVPWYIFIMIGIVIYGVIIIVFLQGVKTITIS